MASCNINIYFYKYVLRGRRRVPAVLSSSYYVPMYVVTNAYYSVLLWYFQYYCEFTFTYIIRFESKNTI